MINGNLVKAIAAAIVLSGCTSAEVGLRQAKGVADDALNAAEFTLCQAATVGSIKRRYGNNPAKLQAWSFLCAPNVTITPKAPTSLPGSPA
jgi:uncharacterized lipoprotein